MTTRIQVRVSTVYERINEQIVDGKTVKNFFFSLNVADEMSGGFERLIDADLTSFAVSKEVWAGIEKKCKELGVAWKKSEKTDKSGNLYLTSKPSIVVLEIELSRALKDSLSILGTGRSALEALKISGNIKRITVRERRNGNSLDLED
jgi:DNA primase large subunit